MNAPLDWLADYEALSRSHATVSIAAWSHVRVTGNDRASFLHNMCTNDIRRLTPGNACEAFLTDVKGKIVSHTFVVSDEESLHLVAVAGQSEKIISHLSRYIIREKVVLVDVASEYERFLVVGPHAAEVALPHTVTKAPTALVWPGAMFIVLANGQAEFSTTLTTDPLAWTALRVESGLAMFGTDFDETFLPQEINRDAMAISFTKGCYLGQETIARIDALGHVNKKIVVVKFAGATIPSSGTKLRQESQEVGSITTSVWSPRFGAPAGLAVVRRGANNLEATLEYEGGTAEVVAPVLL